MDLAAIIRDNPALIGQVASQLGVSQGDVTRGLEQLVPAVGRGVRNSAARPGGLDALDGALSRGQHGRYLDDPANLSKPESLADGNAILGHIFGSKDSSRNVAGYAAEQSGLDSGMLRQLLPVVASVVMAALAKGREAPDVPYGGNAQGPQLSGLERFLDFDGDGSMMDDVLNLAKKFL